MSFIKNEFIDLKNNFIPGEYEKNFLKVRFFLLMFPFKYALEYVIEKLTCSELETYFNCIFKTDFRYKMGVMYGNF